MATILGLGMTHYPFFLGPDENMASMFVNRLQDPNLPETLRTPRGWPQLLAEEWGEDQGLAAAREHRAKSLEHFHRLRRRIDEFAPDLVFIWGDDQYENYNETIIPPWSILAYEDKMLRPWAHKVAGTRGPDNENVWGETGDQEVFVRGNREVAKALTTHLLKNGFETAYAYESNHYEGFSHAFMNTIHYLDYDRRGFDYPVISNTRNCYGTRVIGWRGRGAPIGHQAPEDPPSPPPWRCMDLGREIARFLSRTDLRVALIASGSWSHAFMCDFSYGMWPDLDGDRKMLTAMRDGDVDTWRELTTEELEASGEHELLNWYPLVGAMNELGADLVWSDMVETMLFNSPKVFAEYEEVTV